MAFEAEGLSRIDTFRANARILLDSGFSANQILQSARELGFGVRRAEALEVIRDLREERVAATAAGEAVPEITAFEPLREFRWGTLTQSTDNYDRFDGPHSLLFQAGGEAGADWSDYVIIPEDTEVTGIRFVTEADEPSDPNDTRPGPHYVTSESRPFEGSISREMRRQNIDPSRVARIMFGVR